MFCYKCGAKLDDDARFCRQCGTKVNFPTADISEKAVESTSKKNGKKLLKGLILCLIIVGLIIIVTVAFRGNETPSAPTNTVGNISISEAEDVLTNAPATTENITESTQADVSQETEAAEIEDVVIETIHMSTENMRPTILETDSIKVRLNKFSYANSETVFGVNFIVENDSDKEIDVVLTDVRVNGFDVSTSTGKSLVEPGHKANCDSSVWQDDIDETGESEWDVIEGVVEIREGYWGDALYSVPVVIDKVCWEYEEEYAENNPGTPIEPSDLAEIPEGAIVISSENLYPVFIEENGVTAAVSAYGYANSKTVFEINFTLENNTDEDLSIVLTDVVVDGYDISTSTGKTLVEAGHKAVCDSSVWLRDMKEVGINDWIVLTGTVEIREGYWGDAIYSFPVVIYQNAWTSAA